MHWMKLLQHFVEAVETGVEEAAASTEGVEGKKAMVMVVVVAAVHGQL